VELFYFFGTSPQPYFDEAVLHAGDEEFHGVFVLVFFNIHFA
jgi:hypothetical protein